MLSDKQRVPTDPNTVNLAEDWEVRWWCDRFGCTEVALRRAVDRAGPSAAEIERHLREAAKESLKNTGED
jgi:hypothetical protein